MYRPLYVHTQRIDPAPLGAGTNIQYVSTAEIALIISILNILILKTPDSPGDSFGPILTGEIAPKNNLSSIGLRKV